MAHPVGLSARRRCGPPSSLHGGHDRQHRSIAPGYRVDNKIRSDRPLRGVDQRAQVRAEWEKMIPQSAREHLRNKLLTQTDPRTQANVLLKAVRSAAKREAKSERSRTARPRRPGTGSGQDERLPRYPRGQLSRHVEDTQQRFFSVNILGKHGRGSLPTNEAASESLAAPYRLT